MSVLLVEDERPLALAAVRILSGAGHAVTWAPDGTKGYAAARTGGHNAILLDVLLPGKNGWQILEELRAEKVNTPILMLTAMDETGDKVRGLNLGADDYLAKPFEAAELVARVSALVRREKANHDHIIRIADMVVDRNTRRVTREGQTVKLTRREFDLLEALAVNEGRVLSRETIQDRVWSAHEAFSNTVDVFIGTLRRKLDAPYGRKLIHTEKGFGYVLRSQD